MFELKSEQKDNRRAEREFTEKEFPDVVQECDREEKPSEHLWEKALILVQIERFPSIMLE